MIQARSGSLLARPGVRQFIKFCIVGATSFAIDFGISTFLVLHLHVWWVLARTLSFACAVTNGFFWNQRWTFQAVGHRQHHEQYAMFFSVNVVGWLLNLVIMKVVFYALTGEWTITKHSVPVWIAAFMAATVIVTFWNFFANKHWTFKHKSQAA